MIQVRLTLTFIHLVITQQLPRFLIQPRQKQVRQMEFLMAISVNNHLQGSQYSIFPYIITLHSSKCPIISFWNRSTVPSFPSFLGVMRIPNPSTTQFENLIIAQKDVWHYRHRTTGQLQCSSQPQNLHFHLSLRCVVAKYPIFLRSDLKIDQDMYAYLTPEHKMKLFSEFNVVSW